MRCDTGGVHAAFLIDVLNVQWFKRWAAFHHAHFKFHNLKNSENFQILFLHIEIFNFALRNNICKSLNLNK